MRSAVPVAVLLFVAVVTAPAQAQPTNPTPETRAFCLGPDPAWSYGNGCGRHHRKVIERRAARQAEAVAAVPAEPTAPPPPVPTVAPAPAPISGCVGMEAESGSAGYAAYNPSSGATGCYQIIPSTAAAYGCDLSTPAGQDQCAAAICAGQGSSAWASSGANPC